MKDKPNPEPLPGGELCQKIFEASAEGIMILDINSRSLIRANPAFCRMFGHEEAAVLKLGIAGLHPPEALPGIMVGFAVQASGGNYWDTDVPCLRKDGGVFYADIHSSRAEIDGRPCIIGIFHDTTLRRRAEEALQAQERRLNFLLGATPAIIYTYRASGDFGTTFLSGNIVAIMGYRPEDFMAEPGFWQARLHPEDAARIPAHMKTLFAHGEHSYEYRFLHKDGAYRWMLDTSRLLRDDLGRPLEIVGYWLDITERKRAEAALLERGERIDLLLDSTAEGIYGIDLNGNCTFCNKACLRLLGYERPGDLVGRNMHSLIHSKRPDGAAYPANECLISRAQERSEGIHSEDEVFWRADGTAFPVEYWAYPQLSGGAVVGSVASFVDVSERKRAETELKESEKKYRALFEASRDALMSLAPPSWAFISGNPAAVAMFRAGDEAGFIKHAPWEMSPEFQPDGRPSAQLAREMIEAAMRLGSSRFEWTHRRLNGEEFPAEVLLSRVETTGPAFLQASVQDLTERKRAEAEVGRLHSEALARAARLEELTKELLIQNGLAEAAARAKTAFLSNMTHEMNTPLNSIIGFSEVLADQAFGALNDKQKQYVGNIHSSGRQLLSVIESLFDLVRIDSLEAAASLSVFQLKPALEGIVRLSGAEAAARGRHLSAEAPPGCRLESDEKLLKQALFLLLSNAVKFTPPGGRAGIRAGQTAAGVELAVWDTGIGIAAEDMDKLFQPFSQLEAFEIKKYPGAGVGLFLAKKIAEKLGGSLRAESAGPGKGSVFTITLPGSFK